MTSGFKLGISSVSHLADWNTTLRLTTAAISNVTRVVPVWNTTHHPVTRVVPVWNTTHHPAWDKTHTRDLNDTSKSVLSMSPSPGTMDEFTHDTGDTNTSSINWSEDMLELLNRSKATTLLPVLIYVAVLMIAGVLGNSCVIYIFRYRFRRSASNYFVVCLAALDLITCLFSMPFELLDLARPYIFTTPWACKTMRFVSSVSVISSVFVLMGVAVDRYFKAMRPFSPITIKQTKVICVCSFCASIAFSWPAVFIFGIKTVPDIIPGLSGTECSTADSMKGLPYPMIYSAVLFLLYFICVIVMVVLYGRLNREISKRKQRRPVTSPTATSPSGITMQRSITESSICPGTPAISGNISANTQTPEQSPTKPTAAWEVMESLLRSSSAAGDGTEQTCISPSYGMSGIQDEQAFTKPAAAWKVTDALLRNSMIEDPDNINPKQILHSTSVQFVNGDDECHVAHRDISDEKVILEKLNSVDGSMSLRKRLKLRVNVRKFRMSRTTCVLLSVSLAFIFSFLPYVVVKILQAAISGFDMTKTAAADVLYNLCVRSFFVSNAINPFIYGYLNPHFRTELLRLVGKCLPYCAKCAEERREARVMSRTDSSQGIPD